MRAQLGASDLRGVSEILRDSYACLDLDAFPCRVLGSLRRLIPADHASYNEVDTRTWQSRTVVRPEGADQFPGNGELFARHVHEHPFLIHLPRMADGHPHTIADFLPRTRFHRLGLYADYYRRLGIEHQMGVALSARAPLAVGLALSRHAPDFSPRERALLDLLAPHLRQAYDNAAAVSRLGRRLAAAEVALEASDRAFVVLSPGGGMGMAGGLAARWLDEYFGRPRRDRGLPEELRRWIDRQSAEPAGTPAEARRPLVRMRGTRRLAIWLLDRGDARMLLLHERDTMSRPKAVEAAGLSPREAEVLALVATGRGNREVAAVLGSRPRTVGKHLERIYAKLGVGSRTAAVACLLDPAGPAPATPPEASTLAPPGPLR
jgi:DNA-binding CsgD family transcriptional regulator